MLAVNELNREIIVEKVRSGIAAAKCRGRNGGRPAIKKNKIDYALFLYDQEKHSIKDICSITGISCGSLYNAINKRKVEKKGE